MQGHNSVQFARRTEQRPSNPSFTLSEGKKFIQQQTPVKKTVAVSGGKPKTFTINYNSAGTQHVFSDIFTMDKFKLNKSIKDKEERLVEKQRIFKSMPRLLKEAEFSHIEEPEHLSNTQKDDFHRRDGFYIFKAEDKDREYRICVIHQPASERGKEKFTLYSVGRWK